MTNLEPPNQEIDIFVTAAGPEPARMAALRVAFAFLDWRKCKACKAADVRHAGLPVKVSSAALGLREDEANGKMKRGR